MEESVALDSNKQKNFVQSVKGIKKLLKKQKTKNVVETIQTPPKVLPSKEKKKKKRSTRGLVYLSHIPHGFYENEMSKYFGQFGLVTNVRVIRSKRTGNSKGFAFVEFKDPEVAQVVADTMNNYLMGKRLLKAVYIPPEQQKISAKRMKWTSQDNPTAIQRKQEKKKFNAPKSEEADLKAANNMLKKLVIKTCIKDYNVKAYQANHTFIKIHTASQKSLDTTKGKLKEMGIDYDFFKPVDVPEHISYKPETCNRDVKDIILKKEKIEGAENVKKNKGKKVVKNTEKVQVVINATDLVPKKDKAEKGKTNLAIIKDKPKAKNEQKTETKSQIKKTDKFNNLEVVQLEDFIGIQDSDGDSDGSLEFDSDEFAKEMEEDSIVAEDEASDENNVLEESGESADVVYDIKLPKGKKNTKQSLNKKSSINEKQTKLAIVPKRKSEKKPMASKKAKFEKQNMKTANKLIKKKK